ncbi:MAG: hypothetical protein K2X66_05335 [Cyanobacteria bacterium]|nr:hypothetical protein [Cyanobacteriota bacterium]
MLSLSNFLLQPKVNHVLSKLDDSKSMFSIAVRDGVDNTGRTLMEYKRNSHGGRERLIEEVITTLIWGFGINLLKEKVYDPLAKMFTAIQHPNLDMDLLNKGPQSLTPEVLEKFTAKFPGTYEKLTEVIQKPALQNLYHCSNVAKFLICTGIPVALISLGIPTLNQWLTRLFVAKEKGITKDSSLHAVKLGNRPHQKNTSFNQPSAFQAFGPSPFSLNNNLSNATNLKFEGFGSGAILAAEGVSHLLQNERANTLVVDGLLSGGRFYKGRNWVEKAEIIFREATIVLFLYYAQRPIQNLLQNLSDKWFGTASKIEFEGLKYLRDAFKTNKTGFKAHFQESLEALSKGLKLPNAQTFLTSGSAEGEVEKALVEAVRNYALSGKTDNLILETAKHCLWIPTLTQSGKTGMLDLSQKIQVKPILSLIESLEGVAAKLGRDELVGFEKLMTRSTVGRFSALMGANAICALFLSYICPKIQHYITYKITGKDHFPGLDSMV